MSAAKITQLHVYIIGGVLMLIIGLGLYFTLIKPVLEENTKLQGEISGLDSNSVQVDGKSFTISQKAEADKALKEAMVRRDKNEATLKALEGKYQVRPGERIHIANSDDEMMRITMARWLQLPRVVVTLMENYAQKLAKKHNVEVQTAFAAPASVPNPRAIPRDIIPYGLGGMAVRGDFNRVMRWVQDWNNAPLLVSVDGLKCQLAGTKGEVAATCALTAYVFPTGPGVVIPGAGGGAGGMMPGMPGMPGMGMPGMDSGMGGYGPAMGGSSDMPGAMPMSGPGAGNGP